MMKRKMFEDTNPRAQLLNALLDPFGGGSGNNALTLGNDVNNNNNMFSANGMGTDSEENGRGLTDELYANWTVLGQYSFEFEAIQRGFPREWDKDKE